MVGLVSALVGGGVGFWVGDGLSAGKLAACEQVAAQREHDTAIAYVEYANAAVEAARRELAAESARALSRAKRDAVSASVRMKESADYELLIEKTARHECVRNAAAYDRLLAAIRAANARIAGQAAIVPQDVRAHP